MTGKQIYLSYCKAAEMAGVGSNIRIYSQILGTAFVTVGSHTLYSMLEEAEATGQQIELTYPIPIEEGPSEPIGIRIVGFLSV